MALRLQHRIVIPFVIVVVIATTAAALAGLSIASRALQNRVRSQLSSAVTVVGRSDLALNPAVLQNVRALLGSDVVTLTEDGHVVASTFDSNRQPVVEIVKSVVRTDNSSTPRVIGADCGSPCFIAYRRVDNRPDHIVAIVAETWELEAATRSVARAMLLVALASAVVMVLVGQAVVRRVTAPLEGLVHFARELSPEEVGKHAPVSEGEIGVLADAFNGMLDRLERAQAALVRSEKLALAGMFAARIAHDIRNPLSSIKLQTQLLRGGAEKGSEDHATLTAILHDVNQVESVIQDLVELARPGDFALQLGSVNAVLQEALEQLSAQFTHRKIVVHTKLAEGLPSVRLDHSRLRQAFLNVLVNASEAMTVGGDIVVRSWAEGHSVHVEICDDGAGIDPEILEKVFDPFVSTKREGVGLGLVNAKAVLEGHGGEIRLAPRAPRGTCAYLTLPYRTTDG